MDLIADIGATNSRCALLDGKGRIARKEAFRNDEHSSVEDMLRGFIDSGRSSDRPERAALAIAGPVVADEVRMLNIDWRFSQSELRKTLRLRRLEVLNDFAALAHALPRLRAADCFRVGGGEAVPGAAMAVIGPGSGLGVAAAAPADDTWVAVSGEGGHVTAPACSEDEQAIVDDVRREHGHCSAERLLSGPGLLRIYICLSRRAGREAVGLEPRDVTELAIRGEPLAVDAYDVFFGLLGTVAGNLALTVGARGGVFIAGGIVPRVLSVIERSSFRERFVAKGRYRDYLDAIPTSVITADVPAFVGLKAALGH